MNDPFNIKMNRDNNNDDEQGKEIFRHFFGANDRIQIYWARGLNDDTQFILWNTFPQFVEM